MDDEHGLELAIIWNLVVHKPWPAIAEKLPRLVADFAFDFGQDRLCDLLFSTKKRGLVAFVAEQACADKSVLDVVAQCLAAVEQPRNGRAQRCLDKLFKSFCTSQPRTDVLRVLLEAGASPVDSLELLATNPMCLKAVLNFCAATGQAKKWSALELGPFAAKCMRSAELTHVLRAVLRAVGPNTSFQLATSVKVAQPSFLGQLLLATHGAGWPGWPEPLHWMRSKYVADQHTWDLWWRLREGGPASRICAASVECLKPFPEVYKVAVLFRQPVLQNCDLCHFPQACRERAGAFLQLGKVPADLAWLILGFAIDRSDV